jgi:hypothetical protein
MADFNPNLTQRLMAGAKRRIVPRKQWKSRAKDYSTILIAAGFIWETIIKPAYGGDLPAWVVTELTKALFVAAAISKFVIQGMPPDRKD